MNAPLDRDGALTLAAYTDASVRDGVAGWAMLLVLPDGRRIVESGLCPQPLGHSGPAKTDSTWAEAFAVVRCASIVAQRFPGQRVALLADCEHAVRLLAPGAKPARRFQDRALQAEIDALRVSGLDMRISWIPGHMPGRGHAACNRTVDSAAWVRVSVELRNRHKLNRRTQRQRAGSF